MESHSRATASHRREIIVLTSLLGISIGMTLDPTCAKADNRPESSASVAPSHQAASAHRKKSRKAHETEATAKKPAPNSTPVVAWRGIYVTTAGGFGAYPVPGVAGAPGSLLTGYRIYEDYSYLRDPGLSKDPLDKLKYIPLNASGDVYLTLNGDERLKYEYQNQGNIGVPKTNGAGALSYNVLTGQTTGTLCSFCNNYSAPELRTDFGADLHMTPYLRFYGEIVNGQRWGENLGYAPGAVPDTAAIWTQDLAFVQGLVEVNGYFAGGKEGIQVGRWLPLWGWVNSGASPLPNVFTPALDGANVYYDNGRLLLNAFYGKETVNHLGVLTTTASDTVRIWGSYNTLVLPQFVVSDAAVKSNLDFFYFGTTLYNRPGGNDQSSYTAIYGPVVRSTEAITFPTGFDNRQTVGFRHYGSWGNWTFDNALAGQFGNYVGYDVRAFQLTSKIGYSFNDVAWSPNPYLRFAVGSGGGDAHTVATYQPITQSAYGIGPNAWLVESNLIEVAPHMVLNPLPNLSVDSFVSFLWRYSEHDAVQNSQWGAAPPAYQLTAFVPGRYIGTLFDVRPTWNIAKHVTWSAEFAYLQAGEVLNNVGAKNTFYGFSSMEFKW